MMRDERAFCYYNENDPRAAAWLRQLIADGLLPEGEVDERDIRFDIRKPKNGETE